MDGRQWRGEGTNGKTFSLYLHSVKLWRTGETNLARSLYSWPVRRKKMEQVFKPLTPAMEVQPPLAHTRGRQNLVENVGSGCPTSGMWSEWVILQQQWAAAHQKILLEQLVMVMQA